MSEKNQPLIDHLFRHQYGRMIAILTRIFGLHHLEMIEDAVQDTFITATLKWRSKKPDNPEAWLTAAAKNRVVDIIRKVNAQNERESKFDHGAATLSIDEMFLDHEIADSQLRMIFTACHPDLNPKDQIAFALKTISGFSSKEISSAILLNEETVKKRLSRARKYISEKAIKFELPTAAQMKNRLIRVHEVIYLIFNEGFHSSRSDILVRKELCGEALRLCKMILKKEKFRNGASYALFALMCFHSARLDTKISEDGKIIDLEHQDRLNWFFPLVRVGNEAMYKSLEYDEISAYHFESQIAVEHLSALSFQSTNWKRILALYQQLNRFFPSIMTKLNLAFVHIQMKAFVKAKRTLDDIDPDDLKQRSYLYHGTKAEYFKAMGKIEAAIQCLEKAIKSVTNKYERTYLTEKMERYKSL